MQGVVEFRTFDEMVSVLAANNPHALILDGGRRLERAIDEYCSMHGVRRKSWMTMLANDPNIGQEVGDQVTAIRLRRNKSTHEKTKPAAPCDPAADSKQSLHL